MYENEETIENTNQPSESKWLKILMITGSSIIAFSFLFIIYYAIVWLVEISTNSSIELLTNISVIGLTVFNIAISFGVILLAIGFIELARLTDGIAKIILIISSIGLLLLIIVDLIARVVNAIFIHSFTEGIGQRAYSIVNIYLFIFKLFLIAISLLIVSFSKGKLRNQDKEFNLMTISSFTLQLWIIAIITSSIFMLLSLFGDTSSMIYLYALIALGINQIVQTIEFSLKVSKI